MGDPRSITLPEPFIWSRRHVGDEDVAKWCIVYESRWALLYGAPTFEGDWTRERADEAVSILVNMARETEERVFLQALNSPYVGGHA